MDDFKDETPRLAKAHRVSRMHSKEDRTQIKHTSKNLLFPIHHRRSLFDLSERSEAWRMLRYPRCDYRTPLPEDLLYG